VANTYRVREYRCVYEIEHDEYPSIFGKAARYLAQKANEETRAITKGIAKQDTGPRAVVAACGGKVAEAAQCPNTLVIWPGELAGNDH
jgi:hypothetical protein